MGNATGQTEMNPNIASDMNAPVTGIRHPADRSNTGSRWHTAISHLRSWAVGLVTGAADTFPPSHSGTREDAIPDAR